MAAANQKGVPSFQDFIQAGRKRRQAEELANELLGSKNRRASAPGAGVAINRRTPQLPSLTSRVGITKRSSSTSKQTPATKLQSRISQLQRTKSLSNLDPASQYSTSSHRAQNGNSSEGISIKGAAGPYIVVASNFAPGTTAADIEAVMAPVGGEIQYCKIVAANPTVIAEMAFVDKSGAENVISMFNNKRADGRVLYVYMKQGAPHQFPKSRQEPQTFKSQDEEMEVDDGDHNRNLPPTGPRRAEPQYQDGRYGFSESAAPRNYRRGREPQEEPKLFSDRMMRRDERRDDRRDDRRFQR